MTIATIFIMRKSKITTIAIDWDADAYEVENFRRRAINAADVLGGSVTESMTVDTNGVIKFIDFEVRVA